jgi:hypothetical protein
MPIEDLDFLYQNSVKENIIVLIDSDKRNKHIWIEPNTFQIDFTEPFKFVYGVDILDINIPRTMYSIEDYNNALRFMIGTNKDPHKASNYLSLTVDTRDYNIQEFIEELNDTTNAFYMNNIIVEVPVARVSENRKSILKVRNQENPPRPFVFDIQASSMGSIIGYNSISQLEHHDKYLKILSPTNNFLFASRPDAWTDYVIHKPLSTSVSFARVEFYDGDKPIDDNLADDYSNPIQDPLIYSDISEVTDMTKGIGFFISGIEMNNNNNNNLEDEPFVIYELNLPSIYDSQSRRNRIDFFEYHMREVLNESSMYDIDHIASYTGEDVRILTTKYIHVLNGNKFQVDKTNNEHIMHIIPIRAVGNVVYYVYCPGLLINHITYTLSHIPSFSMTAPGIVKLYGERFVTVHCDNIENHVRGSMMFNDYSPGLALVNLGIQGYSHSRNDFYGITYKEFHPIGKLNNLKFTVRKSDGLLYDFKNVNWHMLMALKYYVPKKKDLFTESVLNPNYMSNFLQYKLSHDINKQDDSDTSDEWIDNLTFRDKCLSEERRLTQAYNEGYNNNKYTDDSEEDEYSE